MKKTVLSGLILSSLLFQPGVAPKARAAAPANSHAYFYPIQPQPDGEAYPYHAAEVVILQPGTMRHLECGNVDPANLPQTPEALSAVVNSDDCHEVNIGTSQLYRERDTGRFILVGTWVSSGYDQTPAGGKPAVVSNSMMYIFDPNHKETFNLTVTGLMATDGENPKSQMRRISNILAYEADIDYPPITEQPVAP